MPGLSLGKRRVGKKRRKNRTVGNWKDGLVGFWGVGEGGWGNIAFGGDVSGGRKEDMDY